MNVAGPKLRVFSVAAIVLSVAGCDPIRFVGRTGRVGTMPDMQAVAARVARQPRVVGARLEVSRKTASIAYAVTPDGGGRAEPVQLEFAPDRDGAQFTHGMWFLGFSPDREDVQRWVDVAWPVLVGVEDDLAECLEVREIAGTVETNLRGAQVPDAARAPPTPAGVAGGCR